MAIGNRKSGFTLIEILLAIGILSLGITAVLFMFTVGVQSHRRAQDRTRAAMLADTVLNQVRADLVFDHPDDLPDHYELDGNQLYLLNEDDERLVDQTEPADRYAEHADFPGFLYSVVFVPIHEGDLVDFYRVTVTVLWGKPPEDADAPLDPRNSEQFVTIVRRRSF